MYEVQRPERLGRRQMTVWLTAPADGRCWQSGLLAGQARRRHGREAQSNVVLDWIEIWSYTASLNSIRCRTRNQWRQIRALVMWSRNLRRLYWARPKMALHTLQIGRETSQHCIIECTSATTRAWNIAADTEGRWKCQDFEPTWLDPHLA